MSISTTRTNTIGTFRDESNGTFRIFTGISYTRGEEVQRDEEGHIIVRDELQLLVPEMLYPLLHSGEGIDEIENTTIDGEHLRIFQGGDRLNPIEIINNETLPVEAPEIFIQSFGRICGVDTSTRRMYETPHIEAPEFLIQTFGRICGST